MDYVCHCGARLRHEPKEDKWLCPQGHEVYTCKQCGSVGKCIPLQWIPQYQRWYCHECKQYAPQTVTTNYEETEHANVTKMDKELTPEQLSQVRLETIWLHEKTVPKWLRGTWQAKLSFKALEKGLTESEKQYLKRRRDTE